jgi:hypothetical protein
MMAYQTNWLMISATYENKENNSLLLNFSFVFYYRTLVLLLSELEISPRTGCSLGIQMVRRPQWINNVPLNGTKDADDVNFFQFEIISKDNKVTYKNSWVTDIPIDRDNIVMLVKGGRARWKIENETFNTLKNQGYHIKASGM